MSVPHQLFPYFGGKSRVAAKIINQFPPHHTYAEPFAGSLAILLRKPPAKREVVNDFDTELVNLYKMAKFRLGELMEAIDKIPASRKLFQELLAADVTYLNDIYRAVRKLYVLRLSYGGRARHFGVDVRSQRFRHNAVKIYLEEFWDRTREVTIECLDAVHFIQLYDSPGTFFYLDPVYLAKDDYAQRFGGIEQHRRLRDLLATIKGKWLMSHHDDPAIKALYGAFKTGFLTVPYTVQGGKNIPTKELLIRNY